MTNSDAAPTGEQKSFRTNNSRDRVNKSKLLDGLIFYPLTVQELSEIGDKLRLAEFRLLLHLRASSPFGARLIEIGVRSLAKDLKMAPGTVSRALKRLAEDKYIKLEILPSKMRVQPKGLLMSRLHPDLEKTEFLEQQESELHEEDLLQISTVVDNIVESELEVVVNNNFQPREFKPGEGFELPKVNQDPVNKAERETEKAIAPDAEIIDQPTMMKEEKPSAAGWQNFVAPGNDPEFFAFVVRRTAKLPQPPADAECAAEGWIRKQGHVLYPQYVAWKSRQTLVAEPDPSSAPPATELLEMTLEQRLAKYQSMWQVPTCRRGIRVAIAAHPEWGLQIGKAGPEIIGEPVTIAC